MSPLFRIGDFQLTGYGLCILAGALAGILLCLRKKVILPALAPVLLGAIVMGHVCWVLFCPKIYEDEKFSLLIHFWQGGYTMYGALIGGTLGALIGARTLKIRPLQLLDTLAPAACAVIFFGRIGDFFNEQGFGKTVDEPLFFPITYCSYADGSYREWAYAVWAWEAIAALVLLGILWFRFRKGAPEGRAFAVFLIGLGTSQMVLEQVRKDSFVSLNPFVRFTQIAAALSLLALLIYLAIKNRPGKARTILTFAAFGACIGAIVFAEYVFDKYHMSWILYLFQAAAGILVFALLRAARGGDGLMAGGMYCGFSLLLILMHYLNGRGSGTLWVYTMLILSAVGLAVTAAVSLPARKAEQSV